MMNDSVAASILLAEFFVVFATAASLLAVYFYIRSKEGGSAAKTKPPRSSLAPIAIGIGAAVLVGMVVHMVFYSPLASLLKEKTPRPAASKQPVSDAELLQMGKGLFAVHCAACHGPNGDAPKGKGANLTRRISLKSAVLNIQKGANNFKRAFPGGMPPMISDTDRAAQVANYVSSGFTENRRGKMLYEMLHCARCHGEDGRGRAFLGPNIREFDLQTVALVLKNGKNGVIGKMPRFENFTQEQTRALGLYVMSLQKPRQETFQD